MANMFVSDAADFDSTTISASSHARAAGTGISGLFRAIADRFAAAQQARLDAEVGRFIESHGGQLTDDLERQISREFGSHSGKW